MAPALGKFRGIQRRAVQDAAAYDLLCCGKTKSAKAQLVQNIGYIDALAKLRKRVRETSCAGLAADHDEEAGTHENTLPQDACCCEAWMYSIPAPSWQELKLYEILLAV